MLCRRCSGFVDQVGESASQRHAARFHCTRSFGQATEAACSWAGKLSDWSANIITHSQLALTYDSSRAERQQHGSMIAAMLTVGSILQVRLLSHLFLSSFTTSTLLSRFSVRWATQVNVCEDGRLQRRPAYHTKEQRSEQGEQLSGALQLYRHPSWVHRPDDNPQDTRITRIIKPPRWADSS